MTGNLEVSNQDIRDLYNVLYAAIKQTTKDTQKRRRLADLKDRLLKVEVND